MDVFMSRFSLWTHIPLSPRLLAAVANRMYNLLKTDKQQSISTPIITFCQQKDSKLAFAESMSVLREAN